MYELSDFRKGLKILLEGQPYSVVDFQHVKPGKGNQFTRTKLKNLLTGSNLERTFKSGERFEVPDMIYRTMNYLYKDGDSFAFMDKENYEQMSIAPDDVGDAANYLTENMEVTVAFFNGRPIGVEVPKAVNLKVVDTPPGLKGNTVTGATKQATLETGAVVQVPLHISVGDILRIDTRTGDYVERANK